jgi:anti-sigma28 factor (negative regulator of flagellin synthesis)
MRIDPKVLISPAARDAREAPSTAAKPGDTATGSASVVKLSAAGMTASAEAAASPTTTSRLQTIRAMLDKGDYPVDLDLLATRIVDDATLRAGRS